MATITRLFKHQAGHTPIFAYQEKFTLMLSIFFKILVFFDISPIIAILANYLINALLCSL